MLSKATAMKRPAMAMAVELTEPAAMKRPATAMAVEPTVWPIPGLDPYYLRAVEAACNLEPFVGVDYEIVRKRQGQRRAGRSSWGKPLKLSAVPDPAGRCDLHVWFHDQNQSWHTMYHRVVALTLLQCYWDDAGKLLRKPVAIAENSWGDYDVHHINSDTNDVRISNLAVLTKPLHRLVTSGKVKLVQPSVWPYAAISSTRRRINRKRGGARAASVRSLQACLKSRFRACADLALRVSSVCTL